MTDESWLKLLGLIVVISPLCLTIILGVSSLVDWKLREPVISQLVQATIVSGLAAATLVLGVMLATGTRHVAIDVGTWVAIPHLYHFSIKFIFDRLSVPFAILSFVLSGTIGAFASKYMHREAGFNRFFVLYALFVLGMAVTALAGTIETLFTGWELVGLSSALLVAFYQERPAPGGMASGCGSSIVSLTPHCCWHRWSCTITGEKAISTRCSGPARGRTGYRP